jgi:hypothetical protein
VRQLHHAVVLAAAADADEVGYAYGEAVAEGAMSTLGCPGCERAHGTLRLLTLALLRLPELAVQAHLIDVNDAAPEGILDRVLERTCVMSAAALRLAHHALEAHAHALGYDTGAWIKHAHERARVALHELEPSLIEGNTAVAQALVRRAAVALTRAAAATEGDGLAVADEIATGLAHLLTLYLVASEAVAT